MTRKTTASGAAKANKTNPSWIDLPDMGAVDFTEALAEIKSLEDQRQAGKVEYPLQHLLLFALAATLSQFDSFELMASWSATHDPWLIEQLDLPPLSRMPSHDTFRHLLRLLHADQLELLARTAASAAAGSLDKRLVLIDGKAQCGTWGPQAHRDASLKVLNAYLPDLRLALGTHAVGAHTNESAQLPDFIASLNLKGATVCINAAGTYKPVAAALSAGKANNIFTLKDNQPNLLSKAACFFEEADKRLGKTHNKRDIRTAKLNTRSKGREVDVKVEVWNAAHNLALLRRLANNLLKFEPRTLSIKGKRLLCASSSTFVFSALNALNVHA
jgi:hypothetical protein